MIFIDFFKDILNAVLTSSDQVKTFYLIIIISYLINLLFIIHLFITGRNKGWILMILIFPFFGGLMYLIIEILSRKLSSFAGLSLMRFFIALSIFSLVVFLFFIFYRGIKTINFEFIFSEPRDSMTKGGIFPAIAGTFYLTLFSLVIALPLGVMAAVFLSEYAKPLWLVKYVRLAINTLAGVPSIVFGLFGLAVFVIVLKFGVSILAGACTLAVLILPVIINASEEAIKNVPADFREASLALGATKRETILNVVLPTALPNILTGAILSVGRAAGETAPIIFTAATFYTIGLPQSVENSTMALPFHIFALMSEGAHPELQKPIAFGASIVLLLLVLSINIFAIIIRFNMRRNKKW